MGVPSAWGVSTRRRYATTCLALWTANGVRGKTGQRSAQRPVAAETGPVSVLYCMRRRTPVLTVRETLRRRRTVEHRRVLWMPPGGLIPIGVSARRHVETGRNPGPDHSYRLRTAGQTSLAHRPRPWTVRPLGALWIVHGQIGATGVTATRSTRGAKRRRLVPVARIQAGAERNALGMPARRRSALRRSA